MLQSPFHWDCNPYFRSESSTSTQVSPLNDHFIQNLNKDIKKEQTQCTYVTQRLQPLVLEYIGNYNILTEDNW